MQHTLSVGHHQYWLRDFGRELDTGTLYDYGNGLVSVQADRHVVLVFTGQDCGDLPVSVEILESEPRLDLQAWNEIVETSAVYTGGRLYLDSPYEEGGVELTLPAAEGQTREYRLRVHAKGRDAGADVFSVEIDEGDEFVEWHLIQIWPAPSMPESRLKLTDSVGKQARAEPGGTLKEDIGA